MSRGEQDTHSTAWITGCILSAAPLMCLKTSAMSPPPHTHTHKPSLHSHTPSFAGANNSISAGVNSLGGTDACVFFLTCHTETHPSDSCSVYFGDPWNPFICALDIHTAGEDGCQTSSKGYICFQYILWNVINTVYSSWETELYLSFYYLICTEILPSDESCLVVHVQR